MVRLLSIGHLTGCLLYFSFKESYEYFNILIFVQTIFSLKYS